VAAATDVSFSVVSGGLACNAGAGLVARLLPAFSRYRADEPPNDSSD
jgi:hypothetical protein